MEERENNILNQILNDEKVEEKPSLLNFVNSFYSDYLGTLNNESEKKYLNNEDERVLTGERYVYTNELGITLINKLVSFGTCERYLFLKINGFVKEGNKTEDIELIERNNLVKEQWKNKFKFLDIYKNTDKNENKIIKNKITLRPSDDGILVDFVNKKEYILLIKPVNETAFYIKNNIFDSGKPLLEHIPEIIGLLFYYKKSVKIIYVGKNSPEKFIEFNIGIRNGKLSLNNDLIENIDISKIYENFNIIKAMLESDTIPPRTYMYPRSLTKQEINLMKGFGFFSYYKELNDYLAGKVYEPFRCSNCKYKELCENLADTWVNKNDI